MELEKVHRGIKIRIYPNNSEKSLLEQQIGNCRFIYNLVLKIQETRYKNKEKHLSKFDSYKLIPNLQKDYHFLTKSKVDTLRRSLENLDSGFQRFFEKKSKYPRLKKKFKCKRNFTVSQGIKIKDSTLKIPGFNLNAVFHKEITDKIKRATITANPSGKYYAS